MKKKFLHRIAALLTVLCLSASLIPTVPALTIQKTFVGVDTMMIYNPATSSSDTLYTGSMLGQVAADTSLQSAGEETGEKYVSLDLNELYGELEGIDLTGVPLEEPDISLSATDYGVGGTCTFFAQPEETYKYQYGTFTCLYSGTHCRVWGFGYSDSATAAAMGQAFDNVIYPGDTKAFGTARYIKDGDKLNILVYPMYSTGLCGFFRPIELLTADELGSSSQYYNHDAAVIHINSFHCSPSRYQSTGLVTLAHEYQHLICMSSCLLGNGREQLKMMSTALNEAMSAAAEEWIYPGEMTELGYVSRDYNESGLIASGQSLYNFTTTSGDIGVYGQALLYSEYLKKQAGTGVFHAIHDYWRTASSSVLTDADALYNAFPQQVRDAIDAHVTYNSDISYLCGDEAEQFMSKMNLAYQIATVLQEPSGIYSTTSVCSEADPRLYTGSGCYIEGGGRLLFATADGNSYTVPAGASSRLIYVGFRDGEMVIPPTTAADYDPSSPYTVTAVSNDPSMGTVECYDVTITAQPAPGYGYAVPAATVLSGEATVVRSGNTFTVSPSMDCTVQINFAPSDTGLTDTWDGTAREPLLSQGAYYISTAEELAGLAEMVNSGNALANTDIYLLADLDLAGLPWTPIGYYPAGAYYYDDSVPFSGCFYGGGHVITGLAIGSADAPYSKHTSTGLFGCVANPDEDQDAVISGLTIRDAEVYGQGRTGILIGYAWGARVEDCQVSGSVSGTSGVGGLAGSFGYGSTSMGVKSITRSFSSASVSSTGGDAGGFLGSASSVDVSLCGATGDVYSADDNVGGFVGYDSYSSSAGGVGYENCYATGDVESAETYVGGFVGYSSSTHTNYCYAAGAAVGNDSYYYDQVGGFAGNYGGGFFPYSYCDGEKTLFPIGNQGANNMMLETDAMKLQSSYQNWNFSYIWIISPYVNEGYPALRWQTRQAIEVLVTAPESYLEPGETLQLTVSLEPSATADQEYTLESSDPETASVSPTGLVTAYRPGAVTITARAAKGGATGTLRLLVLEENTLPGGFGGGSGTAEDPYLISAPAHLEHLASMTNYGMDFTGVEFLQTADLDLHGSAQSPWTPIGTEDYPFRGSYNGNCHTISGLYVDGEGLEPVGLFGTAQNATIACLDITDAVVRGGRAGAVAGCVIDSGVEDCCAVNREPEEVLPGETPGEARTVTVTAAFESASAGGIIGSVEDTSVGGSTVGFCSSEAVVSGEQYKGSVGGIIGRSTGGALRVVACRNFGNVSCTSEDVTYLDVGGIVGAMDGGHLLQCADTGDVTCGDLGQAGGILGSGSAVTISSCFATGAVASHSGGHGSAGIASCLESSSLIKQCYFGGSLPSGDQRAAIVITSSDSTVTSTYYPDSLSTIFTNIGATKLTEAQMKTQSSYSDWDFDGTWTFVEGENNGYPTLRVFHPTWDGVVPTFDRAPFSPGCQDVTVVFNTQGNVFESVQGLAEGQYITGAYDSETNRQEVTISREYLMTLGTGTHTLTAEFGADCQVEFEIKVEDTTPDEYIFRLEDFAPSAGGRPGSLDLLLSAPRDGYVICAAAIYGADGSLDTLASTRTMLSHGGNQLKLELDFAEGETCKLFLLDGDSLIPLADCQEVRLIEDLGRLQGQQQSAPERFLTRMTQIVGETALK